MSTLLADTIRKTGGTAGVDIRVKNTSVYESDGGTSVTQNLVQGVAKAFIFCDNITAVKRSIRNLVFLNFYEKPFNPDIGSDIRATLFEPVSQLSAFVLTRNIEEVVENYEPRARIISITALPTLDRNAYNVSLSFFVVNVPTELVDLTLFLERLR